MKLLTVCIAISTASMWSTAAIAQSEQATTVAACTSALEAGKLEAAAEVAETLKSWRFLTRAELVAPAAHCISEVSGVLWSYDRTAGRFRPNTEFSIDPVQKQKADDERRIKADALLKEEQAKQAALQLAAAAAAKAGAEAAAAVRARKAANDSQVLIGVMKACRNLLKSSPDEAFLNPVCVESFLRDGLPIR